MICSSMLLRHHIKTITTQFTLLYNKITLPGFKLITVNFKEKND